MQNDDEVGVTRDRGAGIVLDDEVSRYLNDDSTSVLRELMVHRNWLNGKGGRPADLDFKDMSGMNLERARLGSASLAGVNLSRSNLRRADLSKASLIGADLEEADLLDADLTDADLRGANLHRASLTGANLRGADLGANTGVNADARDGLRKDSGAAVLTEARLDATSRARSWSRPTSAAPT
jgi:uncharacterized protein YjbI with pentapeptide repeats